MPELPAGMDPLHPAMSERSRAVLHALLADCGVDIESFDGSLDAGVSLADLKERMGVIAAMIGRASSMKAEWERELESREIEFDGAFADAYFEASEALGPRATEGAKKNWISTHSPSVVTLREKVADAKYMIAQCKTTVKVLEFRANMLQSINKTEIAELERMHIHMDGDGSH